ncbi:hypothetical protein, partial [Bilophila wadsworthia]|uniref:hypothetical protein n=1 Tax=Bilophila wadsworthia TaxID=35833 RepID=UPI001E1125FF
SVSGEAGTYPARSSLSTTFFSNPEVFSGARREDFSPAQKRELIPTPSRCQPLSSAFFKKPLLCCHSNDTTTAGCFQHAAEAFAYSAPDPALCQPFFEFFSKTFSSQYPTFLFYCTMRICVFRDDTHEKSPERGLPGPSHQFA